MYIHRCTQMQCLFVDPLWTYTSMSSGVSASSPQALLLLFTSFNSRRNWISVSLCCVRKIFNKLHRSAQVVLQILLLLGISRALSGKKYFQNACKLCRGSYCPIKNCVIKYQKCMHYFNIISIKHC